MRYLFVLFYMFFVTTVFATDSTCLKKAYVYASCYSNDTCLTKAYRRAIEDTGYFDPLIAIHLKKNNRSIKAIANSKDIWSLFKKNKISWPYYKEVLLNILVNNKELNLDDLVINDLPFYECSFSKQAIMDKQKGKKALLKSFRLKNSTANREIISTLTDYIYYLWSYGIITVSGEESAVGIYYECP